MMLVIVMGVLEYYAILFLKNYGALFIVVFADFGATIELHILHFVTEFVLVLMPHTKKAQKIGPKTIKRNYTFPLPPPTEIFLEQR